MRCGDLLGIAFDIPQQIFHFADVSGDLEQFVDSRENHGVDYDCHAAADDSLNDSAQRTPPLSGSAESGAGFSL
jgi:hypothetical protein